MQKRATARAVKPKVTVQRLEASMQGGQCARQGSKRDVGIFIV